jgi:hypothetical protein
VEAASSATIVSMIIVAASRQTSVVTRLWGIWDMDMAG